MKLLKTLTATAITAGMSATAYAGCGLKGDVSVLSNAFPIITELHKDLATCKSSGLNLVWKEDKDHKNTIVTAFKSTSNPYDASIISNSVFSNVSSQGLLRPLDDLVAKYKSKYNIEDSMLIRVDGKIYAIAFMTNTQHFMYRKDLFAKHGLSAPKTYDDVLAAAKKLKSDTSVEYQYGAAFKSGWNLAQEFNNIFLGYGGTFFKPGSSEPAFNSTAGVQALELMKKLKSHMSPNALTLDSGAVQNQLRQGKIPMAFLWASRAAGMDDAEQSKVVGKIAFTSAPAVVKGGNAATTSWWDGVVLPKNSRGNDDVAFQAMMHAISDASAKKHADKAAWLRSSYTPTKYATGIAQSFENNMPSFPLEAEFGLVHTALGKVVGKVLSGEMSAKEALKSAEEDYRKAAKEKGYL